MENNNSLSLINHCKTCTTSCCTNGMIITTEKNHDEILATGAKDHFWKIAIPAGNFYIIDFRMKSCRYLDDIGRCTIEDSKPVTCQTYPVFPKKDGHTVKTGCPAVKALYETDAFKLYVAEARNLLAKQMAETPYDTFCDAFEAFRDRYSSHNLINMQAVVTEPPDLYL